MIGIYRYTTGKAAFYLLGFLMLIHPFIHFLEGGSLDFLMMWLATYSAENIWE